LLDSRALEKVDADSQDVSNSLVDRDALVKVCLAGYQVLLLSDNESYPLLERAKEELEKEGIKRSFMLEDIETPYTTHIAKMENAVKLCREGTIIMIHGKGPGTVTEVANIVREKGLRHRAILFFPGEDYPEIAFSHVEYPAYFPRKYYYRNDGKFLRLLVNMVRQDAYVEANEQADKKLRELCK
jgi:hypothetical protein